MSDLHLTPEEIQILATVDHTMLSQTATWEEIMSLCEDALAYKVASVCIAVICGPCLRISGRTPAGMYRNRVP